MTQNWQQQLQSAIKTPEALLQYLDLSKEHHNISQFGHQQFTTKVPLSFVNRMQKGDINDPLLKQVIPLTDEEISVPDYLLDPLNESAHNPIPGMLHKYHGRILMTLTSTCAINCRYCFRRHFDYANNNVGRSGWNAIFDYIKQHPEIHEVILSGGDPLMVNDQLLHQFTQLLNQYQQIKTLRIHSRMPIVLPARIDHSFLDWIDAQPFNLIIVVHCNHPQELNNEVYTAIQQLKQKNVTILNQSVLMKGINDNADTLIALSHRLFDMQILPYYLHQMDKVQNSKHFAVSDIVALNLHQQLQAYLPGYLVPKLVREIAGKKNKTLL